MLDNRATRVRLLDEDLLVMCKGTTLLKSVSPLPSDFDVCAGMLLGVERYGTEPKRAVIRAVNDTKDNDTVAAIVGAAVGVSWRPSCHWICRRCWSRF